MSHVTITLAMPVFNGAEFLPAAIASIEQQTFQHYRVIVSDNASTDETESICRAWAERDDRVVYIRQEENIGAAPNFNVLFEHAEGPYFKWVAHDDILAPTFLETCIGQLEANPEAVLCHTLVQYIDESGRPYDTYRRPGRFGDDHQPTRFRDAVKFHPCFDVFGVIRTAALAETDLIGRYSHGDGVLLAHLVLKGPFILVDEELFLSRQHKRQSGEILRANRDRRAYAEWFDPNARLAKVLPGWRIVYEYSRLLYLERLSLGRRVRLSGEVFSQAWRMRRGLAADVVDELLLRVFHHDRRAGKLVSKGLG